jgi:hypothetical protein
MTNRPAYRFRLCTRWPLWALAAAALYVLSCGPVLAIAFWLREKTVPA